MVEQHYLNTHIPIILSKSTESNETACFDE